MPCYLGHYKNAAKDRPDKLIRAIESVLEQTYENWELMVIADGCDETVNIVTRNFLQEDGKVKLLKIKKQHKFSGNPRNVGIQNATGDIIIYLDADDIFKPEHLENVATQFGVNDWVWFDCLSYNKRTNEFDVLGCNIDVKGECGTSNFAHKRTLEVFWSPIGGYAKDDWIMINTLKSASDKYTKIDAAGYGICHVPYLLDI